MNDNDNTYSVTVSEPEYYALEALRIWQAAQTNPAFRRELHARETLHFFIEQSQENAFCKREAAGVVGKKKAKKLLRAIRQAKKAVAMLAANVTNLPSM